jgi:hypothetical protein
VAGLGSAVAVDNDVPLRRDPLRRIALAKLGRILPDVAEAHLGEIVLPVVVDGPGNVTSPHLCARLARVLLRWPRIHQESVAARNRRAYLVQAGALGLKRSRWKPYSANPGVAPGNRPLLQLPLGVPSVQEIHLGIAEAGQEPGQKRGVDVPGLAGAVDHHRMVEAQSKSGEQLTVSSSTQQLSGDSSIARPESLGVQIHRVRQVALQVGEHLGAYVHDMDLTVGLPPSQLVGRDQLGKPRLGSARSTATQE